MSDQPRVFIRGIPDIPSIVEVNVRTNPTTSVDIAFTAAVGTEAVELLNVKPDKEGNSDQGKIFQWFKVLMPGGAKGWVRDDLVDIQGDLTAFGYGVYPERVFAFDQQRGIDSETDTDSTTDSSTEETTETTPVQPPATGSNSNIAGAPNAPDPSIIAPVPSISIADLGGPDTNLERIRFAAFDITEAFEGHGYAAYQNYDSGIVSYGRFQFTLAAGSLGTVVQRYCDRSQTPTANELRNYIPPIMAHDEGLRNNVRLKELLIAAASEDVMKRVQNQVAKEGYWDRMYSLSVQPRNIRSPLGIALVFDIAINFGVMNSLLGLAEDELGVPSKSRCGENGVSEEQYLAQLADRRKRGHYAQAERDNLPGLKVRGDFWVNLVAKGDWNLQGDGSGQVYVNSKPVQVKNPSEL